MLLEALILVSDMCSHLSSPNDGFPIHPRHTKEEILLDLRLQRQFHPLPPILDQESSKIFHRGQARGFKGAQVKEYAKEKDVRAENK
jgi:hypothetical protein